MTAPRVGDVVGWADAPDGALVREQDGAMCARFGTRCLSALYRPDDWGYGAGGQWDLAATDLPVTIVALGLTGQESADDLRRLAEVFEVRAALLASPTVVDVLHEHMYGCPRCNPDSSAAWTGAAARLHAAGWRLGMTAEDAARLLEQAGGAS